MAVTRAWAHGYHAKVTAAMAGAAFDTLRDKLGRMPDEDEIVSFAKPKRSPIHKAFQWDDAVAGREYRRRQARELRQNLIEVTEAPGSNEPAIARSFNYVDKAQDDGSVVREWDTTVNILSDAETRALLLDRAKKDAMSFQRRYSELKELGDIFKAIGDTFGK